MCVKSNYHTLKILPIFNFLSQNNSLNPCLLFSIYIYSSNNGCLCFHFIFYHTGAWIIEQMRIGSQAGWINTSTKIAVRWLKYPRPPQLVTKPTPVLVLSWNAVVNCFAIWISTHNYFVDANWLQNWVR